MRAACLPADMGSSLKYRSGLCLIVAVVLIWVISAEVTQVRCGFCNLLRVLRGLLVYFVGGSWLGMHAGLSDWFWLVQHLGF